MKFRKEEERRQRRWSRRRCREIKMTVRGMPKEVDGLFTARATLPTNEIMAGAPRLPQGMVQEAR